MVDAVQEDKEKQQRRDASAARGGGGGGGAEVESDSDVCAQNQYVADAFHDRKLVAASWQEWRQHHKEERARWKQQLLATHHAQCSLLWNAFSAWRQQADDTKERKKRLMAKWFERWGMSLRHDKVSKIEKRSNQKAQLSASTGPHVHLNRSFRVLSSGARTARQLHKKRPLLLQSQSPSLADSRATTLGNLLVRRHKRHFFKFRRAVLRWKHRTSSARELALLEKRAYFFLYYCLMKKSIQQLQKHAVLKRKTSVLVKATEKTTKQRILQQMLATTRQRQFLRQVILAWRGLVDRRRDQASTSRSVQLIVYNRYCSRLLRKAFQSWHARYLQHHVLVSLTRVLRRHSSTLVQLAWSSWKQHIYKVMQLQKWEMMQRMRVMEQVWAAWKHRTSEKRTKEFHRRLAVHFLYQSLLRKGFSSFLLALRHQRAMAEQAERMDDRRRKRALKRDFAQWRVFVTCRQQKSRGNAIAVQFRDGRLMRRVWERDLAHFVSSKRSDAPMIENALQQYHRHIKKAAFQAWRSEWKEQRAREEMLASKAAQFRREKENLRKRQVFNAWVEHLRKRQTSRLVNAHARDHWQVNVLEKSFSQWVARIADFRWRQIQNQRARERYASALKVKCFQFWKRKVEARKRYREQNRKALIHWKLAMERKFFPMLRQYAENKKAQRARMHDALEFRHKLIVSDGVRHWMTASLHLQGQREKQISQSQALHTARVWRTVARIARHWRSLTVKNRQSRDKSKPVGAAFRIQDTCFVERSCTQRIQNRMPPASLQARKEQPGSLQPRAAHENTSARSLLSEFVMLPTNRPQPRRPFDLLVENSEVDRLRLPPTSEAMERSVDDTLHLKYGFNFRAQPFEPLSVNMNGVPDSVYQHEKPVLPLSIQVKKTQEVPAAIAPPQTHPKSPLSQLDALEAQLLVWKARRQEFRAFQGKLENHRHCVQDPSSQE
ncbi:hypothetical protein FI667_g1630, partial [Globisporangium splendens]